MGPERHEILAVGVRMQEFGSTGSDMRVVYVPTPRSAVAQMRRQQFDVVLVQADYEDKENMNWLARLRAARPSLPIVVLHECEPAPRGSEMRLRTTVATAVLSSKTELQVWLGDWLARRAARSGCQ